LTIGLRTAFSALILPCISTLRSLSQKRIISEQFSWKKFQFICEVQTALISNGINLSLEVNAKQQQHLFSATGALMTMDEAFYAAERIPEHLSAHEAACEFVYWYFDNVREPGRTLPYWFARY
jgi:hypothetical protein